VKDLTGLYATNPGVAIAMVIFMLSLGGIPPTAGFMAKLWVFGAAIDAGYIGLAVAGVLNSALSLYYYVRVVVFMFAQPDDGTPPLHVSPGVTAVLILTVAATVVLGVFPRLLFELAEASAATLGAAPALGLR
jgi:NADH-quinone oxidoreductase subunit N